MPEERKTIIIDATLQLHVEYECVPKVTNEYGHTPFREVPVTLDDILDGIEKRVTKLLKKASGVENYSNYIEETEKVAAVLPVARTSSQLREAWVEKPPEPEPEPEPEPQPVEFVVQQPVYVTMTVTAMDKEAAEKAVGALRVTLDDDLMPQDITETKITRIAKPILQATITEKQGA